MNFSLHKADTLDAAAGLAQKFGAGARYIAGGTDLMVQMSRGAKSAQVVIDLSGLDGLKSIVPEKDHVSLGALCTHKDVERSHELQRRFPALCAAARVVGGHQIRNIGTVGGNLANASPAADVGVALLALDARLRLFSTSGRRTVGIDDFFLDPGKSALAAGELIETIEIPLSAPGSASTFIKAGRRKAMEISVVCVGADLTFDATAVITSARISLGSVGPRPLRARAAEALLLGRVADQLAASAAGQAAGRECTPRTDVRSSGAYRKLLVEGLVARAVTQCAEAAARSRGQA